jgi:arylsulfatase A-like enzyme
MCSVAQANSRPNVVIIVADNLGWRDVGYHGGAIDTPAIDGLVERGVELERFYVSPLGSPTRAGLMTGRDPIRLGVAYSEIQAWDNIGVHPVEHFMSQTFKAAGYQSAILGTWGLGHAQETFHPNQRGFDDFWGQLLSGTQLNPPYFNIGGVDFQYNGTSIEGASGYMPLLLGDTAADYIRRRDKNKPLFLVLSFTSASAKDTAPEDLMEKYQNISSISLSIDSGKQQARASYAASVEAMDRSIGNVMNTLEAEGMSDNTIILFMSDNGGAGNADNGDFAGGRGQVLEGGIHVPAALTWPGKLTAGSHYSDIVTMVDVFPTLASAAGVEKKNIRKLDGLDLWPAILEGKRIERRKPVVLVSEAAQYGQFGLTAFNNNWKLVKEIKQDLIYIEFEDSLYRIGEGVDETNNLAEKYPGVVEELTDAIMDIRQQHPITGLRNNMVPPSGWRGPIDWAEYTIPLELLQDKTAAGSPPPFARRPLDYQLGEKGRLIYDCEIKWWSLGFCINDQEEDIKVYRFHEKD